MTRRFAILALIAATLGAGALAGCADHDVELLTDVKNKLCACKTVSCADQELARVPETAKRTPRMQDIARAIHDCHAKRQAAERAAADAQAEAAGHEGHDHEGHDHEGHDHEGHDHAPVPTTEPAPPPAAAPKP